MALNGYNIKKWYLMLSGKSVLHVNQDIGKFIFINDIYGYYNNMMEKVEKQPELLNTNELPIVKSEDGKIIRFPVAIFQYGLGAYDLYLKTAERQYLEKFKQCVDWTIDNQETTGAWNNFFFVYPEHPYGAMAQGEAASLLIRAYKELKDEKYLFAAQSAIDFMLKAIDNGGTTKYDGESVILHEYTHLAPVMNGWIFAWFGLFDYVLITSDQGAYKLLLDRSCETLIKFLPEFSTTYWSMYDLDGKIASPFYHNLHIAQMHAMYQLTGKSIFMVYSDKWEIYKNDFRKRSRAFIKKVWQKLLEKDTR